MGADERRTLVSRFLSSIGWERRVLVVAASAGGSYGSPFVFEHPERAAGYVSIAALLDSPKKSPSSRVPALVIWGELDSPARADPTMHAFLEAHKVVFPQAPHPAYLKDPELFNRLVLEFAGASGKSSLPVSAAWRN